MHAANLGRASPGSEAPLVGTGAAPRRRASLSWVNRTASASRSCTRAAEGPQAHQQQARRPIYRCQATLRDEPKERGALVAEPAAEPSSSSSSSSDSRNGSSSSSGSSGAPALVGEDAAAFDPQQQSAGRWTFFAVELAVVLGVLYAVWISPSQGFARPYLEQFQQLSSNSTAVMLAIYAVFAGVHSGLAALRPRGEALAGPRAFRVLFAAVSLPLAVAAVVYFINHRYDGAALWNVRGVPGVHEAVWGLNFVSFFLLYPSTFNLLEVAAVDRPRVHLYETGVMRITRHPQTLGQGLWCLGHTLWVGSSFMVVTSAALMAHHAFSCWHGDRRLLARHGEAFEAVRARTSAVPFAAILEGRQRLPPDYWREWLRPPYAVLLAVTLGVYWAHPQIQRACLWLGW